jgi:hypothetical protein
MPPLFRQLTTQGNLSLAFYCLLNRSKDDNDSDRKLLPQPVISLVMTEIGGKQIFILECSHLYSIGELVLGGYSPDSVLGQIQYVDVISEVNDLKRMLFLEHEGWKLFYMASANHTSAVGWNTHLTRRDRPRNH